MKNLDKHIAKVIEEHRLDHYLEGIIKVIPWDDLMMAFANVCVFKANSKDIKRDSKEYKAWMKRAYTFHDTIIDARTASVQKRKLKKLENNPPPEQDNAVDS
jgi:hypothetical protein